MTGTRTGDRPVELAGRRVAVAGIGVSGLAVARVLLERGAAVTVLDAADGETQRRNAAELEAAGATVRLGADALPPVDADLVVTSPGLSPAAPLLAPVLARGVPVIGEVELAWWLRGADAAPWLAVTGTNGKTTVVHMLAAMLEAAGARTTTTGNVGWPTVSAVTADPPYDVLAVELSSFQLHWAPSVRPLAAVVLNLAPDHLDWHGSYEAYAAAKARIWAPGTRPVANADDPSVVELAAGRDGVVWFTLAEPKLGALGVADGMLVDRAFAGGEPLAAVGDVRPAAPHNVANALAAAALARAFGVPGPAVAAGLRAFRPEPHRMSAVAEAGGITYVDDSKATNPHAVDAALTAYEHVVWIAGGLLKGARVDDLVSRHRHRMRAAVLYGRDRAVIAEALARHAPDVPVVEVADTDHGVMDAVVAEAARFARPGDTVLLAPAGASWDLFANYGARGDAFAAAVRRLVTEASSPEHGTDA